MDLTSTYPKAAAGRQIRLPKASEIIATSFRTRVATGELKEGDLLPSEPDLMTEFGVSRASLREALRILESDGLIEMRRGAQGGGRIRLPLESTAASSMGLLLQIRGATLADMFASRIIIEPPLVAQLAANRTDEDMRAIRAHIEHERQSLTDTQAFANAAAEFHRILVERADNMVLSLVVSMLDELYLKHLHQFVSTARADQQTLNLDTLRNHVHLADAIEAKDSAAAETLWRYHMLGARNIILGELGADAQLTLY